MVSSYLGRQINWLDEAQNSCNATITRHVRDGATSSVWMAECEAQNESPWVVKIPFSGMEQQTREFLPEADVIAAIRTQYRNKGQLSPVPECYKVDIDGAECLLMPYYQVQWQSILVRDSSPAFLRSGFFSLAFASMELFQRLHVEERTYTLDIKDENFYWLPGEKPLVLDWNRCKKLPQDSRFALMEVTRLLVRTLCTIYTGGDLPNPLPERVDYGWPPVCPRPMRRMLLESIRPGGIQVDRVVDLLSWLQILTNGSWQTGLDAAQQLKGAEAAERVLDCASIFFPDGSLPEQLAFAAAEARKVAGSPRERLKETLQVVEKALQTMDTNLAVQQSERILRDRALPPGDASQVINLYIQAITLHSSRDAGEITIQESQMYALALDAIRDPEAAMTNLKPAVATRIQTGRKQLAGVQELAGCIDALLACQDVSQLILLNEQAQRILDEQRGTVPALALDILAAQVPLFDSKSIQRAEQISQLRQARIQKASELEQRCIDAFRNEEPISVLRVLFSADQNHLALRRVSAALMALENGRWLEAVQLIPAETEQELYRVARARVEREVCDEIKSNFAAVLYPKDIERLRQLYGTEIALPAGLASRLKMVEQLPAPDELSKAELLALQDAHIEPFTKDPNSPIYIANLLETLNVKAYQETLGQLDQDISEKLERLDNMATLTQIKTKLDNAQQGYIDKKGELDGLIEATEGAIRDRLVGIEDIAKRIKCLDEKLVKANEEQKAAYTNLLSALEVEEKTLNDKLQQLQTSIEEKKKLISGHTEQVVQELKREEERVEQEFQRVERVLADQKKSLALQIEQWSRELSTQSETMQNKGLEDQTRLNEERLKLKGQLDQINIEFQQAKSLQEQAIDQLRQQIDALQTNALLDNTRTEREACQNVIIEMEGNQTILSSQVERLLSVRSDLKRIIEERNQTHENLPVAAWIYTIIGQMANKQHNDAKQLCDVLASLPGVSEAEKKGLAVWGEQAASLEQNPGLASEYAQWVNELRLGNRIASAAMIKKLTQDNLLPLYQMLLSSHIAQFGSKAEDDTNFARLFIEDPDRLEIEINKLADQVDGRTMEVNFWQERLEQLHLAELLLNACKFKSETITIIRSSIPSDVWQIAENRRKNQSSGDQSNGKPK